MAYGATWIWYPGDFEIWLGNKMNNRRTERGAFFPPFWKQDSHYVTVEFSCDVALEREERVMLAVEGVYNVKIDGRMLFGMPRTLTLGAGQHRICVKVHNQVSPPALYLSGETFGTDSSWRVTFEDKEWIDESGKASDTSATDYQPAGFWNFNNIALPPSTFQLSRQHLKAANMQPMGEGRLYDFGRETFGFVCLRSIEGNGTIHIYYGESEEEALDCERCETLDRLTVEGNEVTDLVTATTAPLTDSYTLEGSRCFRYVFVVGEGCTVGDVEMDYEYMPETEHGTFRCNDEELNKIWDIGVYTMQLTAREFFIDGIKRDRWVWSGDASQSYLMNYYLFGDSDMVKRTTWLLAGKQPITSHINTIMDYTFYWIVSLYDYYLYTADSHFLLQIYPTLRAYMRFIEGRLDGDGMAQWQTGDWVFVDWADKPMDKQGQLAFEQILLCRSYEAAAAVAKTVGEDSDAQVYSQRAASLREALLTSFWSEEQQALVHNRRNGQPSIDVFRYPNMFAVIYGYLNEERQAAVKQSVMLNDNVLHITTPYMRFYELEALCILGEQDRVMKEIKAYWGGMLREGATSFWEKYNPEEKGVERLAMYGRPYGKSLCHAWGASPIYLLGKYYIGVQPTAPGYAEYVVRPQLGALQWMEGTVPTPYGRVYVKMTAESVTVRSDGGKGTRVLGDMTYDIDKEITVAL